MSKQQKIKKKFKVRKINQKLVEEKFEEGFELTRGEDLDESEKVIKVTAILNNIQGKIKVIKTVNDELCDLIDDEEELERLFRSLTDFEISTSENMTKLQQMIKVEQPTTEREKSKKVNKHSVKLPKLSIKPFGGDIIEWCSFLDSFNSAIHQSSLSDVEKFNYLRGYLKDEALKTIEGLTLSEENYEKALNILKERYGNTDIIISRHMKELVSLPSVTSDSDLKGLRRFYDALESHIRRLLSLKIDAGSYGMMLKSIILEKLPNQVRLLLTRDLRDTEWDLTKLQTALKNELLAREACSLIPSSDQSEEENFSTASALVTKNYEFKCVFCQGKHYSDKCDKITDVEIRKNHLRNSGRCFMCLKPKHTIRNCTSSRKCFYCKGHHNSAICEIKFKSAENSPNLLVKSETSFFFKQLL